MPVWGSVKRAGAPDISVGRTVLIHRPIPAQSEKADPPPPRDLVDFHLRWAEYRPLMVALQGQEGLSPAQSTTLGWLIALSDRVSAVDFS